MQHAVEMDMLSAVARSLGNADNVECTARVAAILPATDALATLASSLPELYGVLLNRAAWIIEVNGDKLMKNGEVRHALLSAAMQLLKMYEQMQRCGRLHRWQA